MLSRLSESFDRQHGTDEDPTAIQGPLPRGADRPPRSMRWLLLILAICTTVAALRLGRELLIPLVMAVLLALVLSGIVEAFSRRRIPRAVSALVLLLIMVFTVGAMLDALWMPAEHWFASAPRVLRMIEHKIRPAQSLVRRIDDIANRAGALANANRTPALTAPLPAPSVTPVRVVTGTGWLAAQIGMGLALTLLLLAAGPATLARMTAALAAEWHAVHVLRIIDAVRVEVSRYYGTLALINIGFGIVTGAVMWLLGMPNPMLWGALAGLLNFIPYLGCATTFAILTLVSLVAFDGVDRTLLVCASFLLLAAVEGHIIEPIFLGRRLNLNPLVVLIALWVGGWIWGIAGVVFALPALVATKVAATHSRRGGAVLRFLSPQGTRAGKLEARETAAPHDTPVTADHASRNA